MGAARSGGIRGEVLVTGDAVARVGGILGEILKTNPFANARVGGIKGEILVQTTGIPDALFYWGVPL